MADKQEQKTKTTVTQEQAAGGLLDEILEKGLRVRDEGQAERGKNLIADFVKEAMHGQLVMSKNLESTINARIAEIDRVISAQLNEVMHHEAFQKLEGSWRRLRHLVVET